MTDWPRPPAAKDAEAGLGMELAEVDVDPELLRDVYSTFDAESECPPLAAAIVFGAARLLLGSQLQSAQVKELLEMASAYSEGSSALTFRAHVLREDLQRLRFNLAGLHGQRDARQRRAERTGLSDVEPPKGT